MSTRTALTGLLAAAVTAIFPASAVAASIAPTLVLEQGAGTTAGSSPATGLNINFHGSPFTESDKSLTIGFPPGFLIDVDENGGACVASSAISPLCVLGTGTYGTDSGPEPATLYLAAPVDAAEAASVVLDVPSDPHNPSTIGALTLGTSPVAYSLSFTFANAPGPTELQFTLTSPRLPTSCAAASFSLHATGETNTSGSGSAPLAVTGCSSLPYAPTVAATVTDVGGYGAKVVVSFTQGAGESATSGIVFGNPTGVKINKVLSPCFYGTTCTVGTASASSPLLPSSALSTGLLTLAGSINSGNLASPISGALTLSFPPPYPLTVTGPIDLTEHTLTFGGVPDIPLSTLNFSFEGTPAGPAFTTECEPGTIAATLIPQDGNPPVKVTGPVTNVDCPPPSAKPTASGSISGLAGGRPKLQLRATRGSGAPDIASLSIGLPSGLSFGAKALVRHRVCKGAGKHRKCTTNVSAKGLSLSGAAIKSAHVQGGALVIAFAHDAASVSLTARGPLVLESKTLERKAKQHKAGTLVASLRITDASGRATAVSVP
jgi:hypothetical protein